MGLTPSIGAGQFHSTIKTQTLQSTARSSHPYDGKPLEYVWEQLGPSTGYFRGGTSPAYELSEDQGDSWQIVFLPRPDQKILGVAIQKSCCYKPYLWSQIPRPFLLFESTL